MAISKRQAVHWMFDVAVAVKAFNGALEIAGGSFLVVKPGWIGSAWRAFAGTPTRGRPRDGKELGPEQYVPGA